MVVSYRLPCPACKKNATVAPGLLTTRYQRVRCPYCFYEWHANKGMLVALETKPPPPINTPSPRNMPDAPLAGRRTPGAPSVVGDTMPGTMPTTRNPAGAPFAINVSGTIKGNMGGDADNPRSSSDATDIGDDELLSLDLSRMNDTDYQQYQANQERLKKFKRKIKTPGSYDEPRRGLDWFSIIGIFLGLVVAAFLFLVLLIIFRDPIVRHIPQAEELYNWLSYFINRLLR